eukprot:Awhi_evm1s1448
MVTLHLLLGEAKYQCNLISDCGGITFESNQYTLRKGITPIALTSEGLVSYVKDQVLLNDDFRTYSQELQFENSTAVQLFNGEKCKFKMSVFTNEIDSDQTSKLTIGLTDNSGKVLSESKISLQEITEGKVDSWSSNSYNMVLLTSEKHPFTLQVTNEKSMHGRIGQIGRNAPNLVISAFKREHV